MSVALRLAHCHQPHPEVGLFGRVLTHRVLEQRPSGIVVVEEAVQKGQMRRVALTLDTLQDRDFFRMTPPDYGFLPPPSGTLQVTAASTTTTGSLLVYLVYAIWVP